MIIHLAFALQVRFNSTLVVAEHDDKALAPITLNAITAASKLGADVSVLVTGANSKAVADQVAKINGVKRVLVAQDEKLKNNLPGIVTEFTVLTSYFRTCCASNSCFPKAI